MAESDDWMEGTAEAYAQVIRVILKEALNYEGFWLEDERGRKIESLDINWNDAAGKMHYYTLYDRDDRG